MGTEQTHPVGTILTRKTKQDDEFDELRVIAAGEKIIVTSNLEFTTPFELGHNESYAEYEFEFPEDFSRETAEQTIKNTESPEDAFRRWGKLDSGKIETEVPEDLTPKPATPAKPAAKGRARTSE